LENFSPRLVPLVNSYSSTMIIVDEALRTRLALTNESVQLQVCSDYNFHSEEQFKINYWTKVIETFSSFSVLLGPLSASTVRTWWGNNVQPRTLPGLEKVLFQSLRENKIIIASDIIARYHQLYRPVSSSGNSSIPRRAVSLIGSLARGVWNLALGSEEDHSQDTVVSPEEIFFVPERVDKFSQQILEKCFDSSSNESELVTDEDLRKRVETIALSVVEDINVHGINEGYPFCRISTNDMTWIVTTILVERFGAIPFIAGDNIKCLKLFRSQKKQDKRQVTELDKAYMVSKAAIARLTEREAELNKRWGSVDVTIREHLKYGRKNLALTALRERKMIEKQIDDVQIYKLKLQETSSMTETAVMQKFVVDAIAETSKAGKSTLTSLEQNVHDVMDEAAELRQQVNEIGNIIGGAAQVDDEESLEEYEKLVRQLAEEKEKELETRLIGLTIPSEKPVSPGMKQKESKAPQILLEDS